MKVYVDFKDLDAEDMPSNISNKYNLQIRSINGGSDYKNIKIQSLADYTKQVRKEVAEEIKSALRKNVAKMMGDRHCYPESAIYWDEVVTILDKIGEKKC